MDPKYGRTAEIVHQGTMTFLRTASTRAVVLKIYERIYPCLWLGHRTLPPGGRLEHHGIDATGDTVMP